MDALLFVVALLLMFGWGGFYLGGPVVAASGLALVLMLCVLLYVMGGLRTKTSQD
jgi:hypothetical protein